MLHTNTPTSTATTAPMRKPSSCAFKAPPRPKGKRTSTRRRAPRTARRRRRSFSLTHKLPSNVKPAAMPAAIEWQPVIPNCRLSTISIAPKNSKGKASRTRRPPSLLSVEMNQAVVNTTPTRAPQPYEAGPINTTPPVMKARRKTPTSRPLSLSFRDGIGHMNTSNKVQIPNMRAHHFMPRP